MLRRWLQQPAMFSLQHSRLREPGPSLYIQSKVARSADPSPPAQLEPQEALEGPMGRARESAAWRASLSNFVDKPVKPGRPRSTRSRWASTKSC